LSARFLSIAADNVNRERHTEQAKRSECKITAIFVCAEAFKPEDRGYEFRVSNI